MPSSSHNSIAGNFERLRLHNNNNNDNNDSMPAETRAMRRRGGRTGSSAAPVASSSSARAPGRSQRQRPGGENFEEVDEDSDDDESDVGKDRGDDDGDRGSQQRPNTFWEIWSLYDPSYLTPRELVRVDETASRHSEMTQKFSALGAVYVGTASNTSVLQRLEQIFPSEYRGDQLIRNMERRYNRILSRLQENLRSPSGGGDVIDTVNSLRELFGAIRGLIRDFPSKSRRLVAILFHILKWIFESNTDLFQGTTTRPQYVDPSSHDNVYRFFLSENGQPHRFFEVLLGLNGSLLRHHRGEIEAMSKQFWYDHEELHTPEAVQRASQLVKKVWGQLQEIRNRSRIR